MPLWKGCTCTTTPSTDRDDGKALDGTVSWRRRWHLSLESPAHSRQHGTHPRQLKQQQWQKSREHWHMRMGQHR